MSYHKDDDNNTDSANKDSNMSMIVEAARINEKFTIESYNQCNDLMQKCKLLQKENNECKRKEEKLKVSSHFNTDKLKMNDLPVI